MPHMGEDEQKATERKLHPAAAPGERSSGQVLLKAHQDAALAESGGGVEPEAHQEDPPLAPSAQRPPEEDVELVGVCTKGGPGPGDG